jgi:PAS domain S-box-containing protein
VKERVLVVEDNVALAENVAEMLQDEGIEVATASDANSAKRLAAAQSFDLAVVDIGLAGSENGLDLLPALRSYSPNGEILLMTGNATLHSALEAIRRGVYAYLPKPFEPEHLVTLAKRALAQVALKRDKEALTYRLSASEALYRGVVETVEACILGLSEDGEIRFANRFAAERLQGDASALLGRSFTSLVSPEAERSFAQALTQAAAGEAVRDYECRHVVAGRLRVIRWTLTPIAPDTKHAKAGLAVDGHEADNERVHGLAAKEDWQVLAVGIDISTRLELERKTAETEAMAVMGTLTTSLAHEIRNPLNAAKLQLELLMRRAKRSADLAATQRLIDPAALVRAELERLSVLLDDFLNLARPRQLDRRPCSAAELIEAVVQLKQPLATSLGIELLAKLPRADLTVRADADKFKQVLLNLVGNAIDALAERAHGRIEVSAEPGVDGSTIVSVHDDGPGIDAQLLGTAFHPFVTSKQGGTGLGLAIVRKIVVQHGGEVELLPRPGGGTIARFNIAP